MQIIVLQCSIRSIQRSAKLRLIFEIGLSGLIADIGFFQCFITTTCCDEATYYS